jgi:phospholipase/lecithinase/hemolysin
MSDAESQFSLTCAALSTRRRAKQEFALRSVARSRAAAVAALFLALAPAPAAPRLVVIGDSLTAEYDSLTGIAGVDDPTEYAAITVPGWESMSWAEVIGRLRAAWLNLGSYRTTLPGWNDLRFTGYQFNFAIPGFEASQYEDIVTSSIFQHQQYYLFRRTLETDLRGAAAAVVWIGSNELRANYGSLYDGTDPQPLIDGLRRDIGAILNFVRNQGAALHVVVANLPDLNAAPSKLVDHPDPLKRARVTSATMLANQVNSELAAARGMAVADVFTATRRVIEGQPTWFGPIVVLPGSHPDNHPQYAFTRDGLHPNTCMQTEIARIIIDTFNTAYATGIPQITDSEALGLMGINPQQPYLDWVAAQNLAPGGMGDDPDGDRLVNLAEFVFDLNPKVPSAAQLTIGPGAGAVVARYHPDAARLHFASVTPQWSTNLKVWSEVPATNVTTDTNGWVGVSLPPTNNARFLRLQVAMRPVQ